MTLRFFLQLIWGWLVLRGISNVYGFANLIYCLVHLWLVKFSIIQFVSKVHYSLLRIYILQVSGQFWRIMNCWLGQKKCGLHLDFYLRLSEVKLMLRLKTVWQSKNGCKSRFVSILFINSFLWYSIIGIYAIHDKRIKWY